MKKDQKKLTQDQDNQLTQVSALAKECNYEEGHTHQVTHLALKLFDELPSLHKLGFGERFYLQCAALLHDIGWIEGQKAHHKTALRLIRKSPTLTFDKHDRLMVGSIARYHRKALPNKTHKHYMALQPSDRRIVSMLGAILRLADGLDRTHQNVVQDLTCSVSLQKVVVSLKVKSPADEEHREAMEKSDLFEKIFNRKVEITWKLGQKPD